MTRLRAAALAGGAALIVVAAWGWPRARPDAAQPPPARAVREAPPAPPRAKPPRPALPPRTSTETFTVDGTPFVYGHAIHPSEESLRARGLALAGELAEERPRSDGPYRVAADVLYGVSNARVIDLPPGQWAPPSELELDLAALYTVGCDRVAPYAALVDQAAVVCAEVVPRSDDARVAREACLDAVDRFRRLPR